MRIAVPSESAEGLKAQRSGHFGHAAYFAVVDIQDGVVRDVETVKNIDHDAYGCGGVIDYVSGLGVDAILTAGMGPRPFSRFTEAGITVYHETTKPIVGDAIELFIKGGVEPMDPDFACRH